MSVDISCTCSKFEKFPDKDKKIVKLKIKEVRNMKKNVKFCMLELTLFFKLNNIIA